MKDPIIITGIPRSGKGLISGILSICGVYTGHTDKMYENNKFHELTAEYLINNGMDNMGQAKFKPTSSLSIPVNWREEVISLIKRQGYVDGPWLLKSAHASLMWPVWNHAFPKAKYLIIRRRTGDIVSSCMKTAYMQSHSTSEGWVSMCREYDQRFVEMINAGLDCKVIWPHRMAYGDYQQIYEMLEWLGLEWKTEVLDWVDPKFKKIRKR